MERFRQLVMSAVASGEAYIAAPDGSAPPDRELACGWRQERVPQRPRWEDANESQFQWRARGPCIGWLGTTKADNDTGTYIYLEPAASYKAAARMAADGNGIEVGVSTLKRRFREAKLLVSTDKAHETITVRRTLQGASKDVLHLNLDFLNLGTDEEQAGDNDL